MPRALSNNLSPLTTMWPRCGRPIPASALITLVLPEPERPNNPTTGASARNATASSKVPRRCSTSTSIMCAALASDAMRQPFGGDQRADRQQYRDRAEPQRLGVPTGGLHERVDRERKRLGFSRNVRDERDRGYKLAQTARKRKQHAGDDAWKRERQRDGNEHPGTRAAERACDGLEALVDRRDRQPNRAHHQRKAHDRRRECGPRPPKREDEPEPMLEPCAEHA